MLKHRAPTLRQPRDEERQMENADGTLNPIRTMVAGWAMRVVTALSLFCAILIAAPSKAAHGPQDWVNSLNYNGQGQPSDAIVGGHTSAGAPVYLCRAYHNADLQPGWTLQGDPACHFSYGGQELSSTDFDWWVPPWQGVTGPTPVVTNPSSPYWAYPFTEYGYPPFPFTYMYSFWTERDICRVGSTPGKYGPDLGGCLYPYGGVENYQPGDAGFDVLVDLYSGYTSEALYGGSGVTYGWGPTYANYNLSDGRMIGPYVARAQGPGSAPGGGSAQFPLDAIVGGMDVGGQPLYLCSAQVVGASGYGVSISYQPGKARTDWNACDVSNAGTENYEAQYFVLVPNWMPEYGNNFYAFNCTLLPGCQETTRPIPVGVDTDGSTLYACQVSTPVGVYPGKIAASFTGGCSYAQNGVENYSASYSILTDGVNYPPYPQ
jgi:hypothetical protein